MVVDGKEDKEVGGKDDVSGKGSDAQREVQEDEIIEMATKILDLAMGTVIEGTYEKVMREDDLLDNVAENGVEGEEANDGGCAQKRLEERVAQAAMISEAVITPTRASPRLAKSGRLHSMEKAKRGRPGRIWRCN
ncbi:hypothetical protein E2562_026921 [Oryza meyeriana var. granulata]|uniref:Uncharacterized protein n=1 Tax=Oryza meyeriana var. granulata TaxID=110450 RepID=A0A6G1CTF8_9ORYZ|nr:hypothetical protein E2562_026921 [Oryza meyeriana var. granulata]